MRKDSYKSKRTKRTESATRVMLVIVVLALLSPFFYHKFLVKDSITEYKELRIISVSTRQKVDHSYNFNKRHHSGASKTTTAYYIRVDTSELDCADESKDIDVSYSIYDNAVEGEYHKFTVVTDTLITGKKRVRVYY